MTAPEETVQINIEPINTAISDDEETVQIEQKQLPESLVETLVEPQGQSPPIEHEIRRDKKGRRITQKRIESTRESQKIAMKKRAIIKKKAELYDQLKPTEIDYDYLTAQLLEKLKLPKPQQEEEKITPVERFRKPREFFNW